MATVRFQFRLAPPTDDIPDKNMYINEKLTPEQQKQLASSAEQFADILEWGKAASRFDAGYEQAATNVQHYRRAHGADRVLTSKDVEDLEKDLPRFKGSQDKYRSQFLDDVARQVRAGSLNDASFIMEEKPGDYWIAGSARPEESRKWYYAMGGFLFSFGARAKTLFPKVHQQAKAIVIEYKVYIYDRYNWDLEKAVTVPADKIDALDYLTPGSIEPLKSMELPDGSGPYISTHEVKAKEVQWDGREREVVKERTYGVSDSVLGSLAAKGKADFFDIRGESAIRTVTYGY